MAVYKQFPTKSKATFLSYKDALRFKRQISKFAKGIKLSSKNAPDYGGKLWTVSYTSLKYKRIK